MDFLRPRPWRTWANLTSPSSANRTRHPLTDAGDTDNAWAIAVFAKPSAAINNARARTTSRCGADDDRATVSRTSRCPGDTNRAGTGGRIPGSIPTNHQLITGHTSSEPLQTPQGSLIGYGHGSIFYTHSHGPSRESLQAARSAFGCVQQFCSFGPLSDDLSQQRFFEVFECARLLWPWIRFHGGPSPPHR